MATNWVAFQATVPDWAIPQLQEQIARYAKEATEKEQAAMETREQAVRRTLEAVSGDGWALIRVLADLSAKARDGWVPWGDVCSGLSMDRKRASGVLGALERATKKFPPLYERGKVGDESRFRMTSETTKVIFDVVHERGE